MTCDNCESVRVSLALVINGLVLALMVASISCLWLWFRAKFAEQEVIYREDQIKYLEKEVERLERDGEQ